MFNKLLKLSFLIVAVVFLFAQYALAIPTDDDLTVLLRLGYFAPVLPEPDLSSNGKTLYNGGLPVVYMDDPNPSGEPLHIPPPFNLLGLSESASASFLITYVPNGDTDRWGEPCYTFPSQAHAPFNAAASIWGNILQSDVPITIRACWANLGSSSILGYSGGGYLYRDFTGAPVAHTWYGASLANALHGADLDEGSFDMHITFNLNFSWYYGTDGSTPAGQHDLVSVVLHEIAHGLNFSGSMSYSSSSAQGSWGYDTGYPNIYDTFMRDGSSSQLIDTGVYTNPSTALGTALTSNNIWFHGSSAIAANGGMRVKMYAPATWNEGSSYSHLDFTTFNDTANELMVYAISAGESVHDPGPVTKGLLKDLGWSIPVACGIPSSIKVPSSDTDGNYTVSWGASSTSGVIYVLQEATNSGFTSGLRTAYTGTALSASITGRTNNTYYYRVKATKSGYTDSEWRTESNGCVVTLSYGIEDKIGVFRMGSWYLDYNGNGVWDNCTTDRCYKFGASTDTPIVGDWNGDGYTEIGVKRGNEWYLDYNGNGAWDSCMTDRCYNFSLSTDIPVVGDWDYNGIDEIGVFRNGRWYLDYTGNGTWQNCREDLCAYFGASTDIPLAGYWNSVGYAEIGVFRNGYWYLDHEFNDYWDGCGLDICYSFGLSTDTPIIGDWNGDGYTEIGVKRANKWYLDYNGSGTWDNCTTDRCYTFGAPTDLPVVGNW